LRVVGRISCAGGAGPVYSEVGSRAVAVSCHDVEGFVGLAGDAADSEVRVVEGVGGA